MQLSFKTGPPSTRHLELVRMYGPFENGPVVVCNHGCIQPASQSPLPPNTDSRRLSPITTAIDTINGRFLKRPCTEFHCEATD